MTRTFKLSACHWLKLSGSWLAPDLIGTRGAAASNQIATKTVLRTFGRTYERELVANKVFILLSTLTLVPRDTRFELLYLVCALSVAMSLRQSTCRLSGTASQAVAAPSLSSLSAPSRWSPTSFQRQLRSLATAVHPVTQDATSSKGPTAMVFMNMGGPSTTDEVGDFLSRLFVSWKASLPPDPSRD